MGLSKKFLIQMAGAPGSGKSTVANLLSQELDGVVINHDLIKAFFLEQGFLFDQSAKLTYSFDWVLAEDMIKQGRSVIIDSICNYNEVLEQGTALARRYGYNYKYVECRVTDLALLDERLRHRVSMRSQRTGVSSPPQDALDAGHSEDPQAKMKKWIENPCRPAENAIIVDSTCGPNECLAYILSELHTSAPAKNGN
jgi:predicted kinase